MRSLGRRLEDLEARTGRVDEGAATSKKVMRLLTVEELHAYVSALRRMKAGEKPVEEDGAILARVRELYEEVGEE